MLRRISKMMLAAMLAIGLLPVLAGSRPAHADTGANWTGSYYANPALQGAPVFTRIDPAVVFNWGPNPPGPGLGSQYWSARWQTVQYLNAGRYRFTVTVDDGVRLYVDGQLLLDAWRDQAATTYYADVTVTTGNHAIQVDYYQGLGAAQISVQWQPIQVQSFAWLAQYFNNPTLLGAPALARYENSINYFWGLGSPAPGIAPDQFSARWTATLPFQAATYRFVLAGDDGVRLFIDDIPVIDQWRVTSLVAYSIDVPLSAGLHTLRVEYFDSYAEAAVRLTYEIAVGSPYPGRDDQWYGEYFSNPNLAGSPVYVRTEGRSGINYNWGFSAPVPGLPQDHFSVRWTRRICTPGRPTMFYLLVDDGARFYIDTTLILDVWRVQSATLYRQLVDLTQGCHDFRLEYMEATERASVNLTWDPPDGQVPPQPIPGQPPITGGVTGIVQGASVLNVRSGPGTSYDVVTQVRRDQPLILTARNADSSWVRVTVVGTSVSGWVNAGYVNVLTGSISSLPVAGTSDGNGDSTGVRGKLTSSLRLRTGPGTNYPQIALVPWGAVVDIRGRSANGQWLQVQSGTQVGWVLRSYVIVVSGNLLSVPITG